VHVRSLVALVAGVVPLAVAGGSAAAAGHLALAPCGGKPLIECGSISVPLYRSDPGAGRPLTVRFRVYRHTDGNAPAAEPVVAFEGVSIRLNVAELPATTEAVGVAIVTLKSSTTIASAEVVPPPGSGLFTEIFRVRL